MDGGPALPAVCLKQVLHPAAASVLTYVPRNSHAVPAA
jgi:hypothetical protein